MEKLRLIVLVMILAVISGCSNDDDNDNEIINLDKSSSKPVKINDVAKAL